MKCCSNPNYQMLGGIEMDNKGDYFERSCCTNCEAEFLNVWKHASETVTRQGDEMQLPNSFDLLYDLKTYGALREKVEHTTQTLGSLLESIETHKIEL